MDTRAEKSSINTVLHSLSFSGHNPSIRPKETIVHFSYPCLSKAKDQNQKQILTSLFTKYGIIDGKVETVSADATADEQRGLIYKARIQMEKNFLNVDGRNVNLVPGMGISAEIKIGKRLLIEYITAPLLRYKDESMSEK